LIVNFSFRIYADISLFQAKYPLLHLFYPILFREQ